MVLHFFFNYEVGWPKFDYRARGCQPTNNSIKDDQGKILALLNDKKLICLWRVGSWAKTALSKVVVQRINDFHRDVVNIDYIYI